MAVDLISENPDAQKYLDSALKDIEKRKLFPEEQFRNISIGVLMTTTVDSHSERFAPTALRIFERRIEQDIFLVTSQHDPRIPPVGRVLAARTFFAPKTQAHFVAGLVGYWDLGAYRPFSLFVHSDSMPTISEETVNEILGSERPIATVGVTRQDFDILEFTQVLEDAPPLVSRRIVPQLRKAFDPITTVSVSVSLSLLLSTPFLKELQKRLGLEVAEQCIAFAKWLADGLAEKIKSLGKEDSLVEIKSKFGDCDLSFVIETSEPAVVREAKETLPDAAENATRLALALHRYLPIRICYLYDSATNQWIPRHAVTKSAGVITDAPQLVALEGMRGFSVSGEITDEQGV